MSSVGRSTSDSSSASWLAGDDAFTVPETDGLRRLQARINDIAHKVGVAAEPVHIIIDPEFTQDARTVTRNGVSVIAIGREWIRHYGELSQEKDGVAAFIDRLPDDAEAMKAELKGMDQSSDELEALLSHAAALTDEEIEAVLAHELAHVRAGHSAQFRYILGAAKVAMVGALVLHASNWMPLVRPREGMEDSDLLLSLATGLVASALLIAAEWGPSYLRRRFEMQADEAARASDALTRGQIRQFKRNISLAFLEGVDSHSTRWGDHHPSLDARLDVALARRTTGAASKDL